MVFIKSLTGQTSSIVLENCKTFEQFISLVEQKFNISHNSQIMRLIYTGTLITKDNFTDYKKAVSSGEEAGCFYSGNGTTLMANKRRTNKFFEKTSGQKTEQQEPQSKI